MAKAVQADWAFQPAVVAVWWYQFLQTPSAGGRSLLAPATEPHADVLWLVVLQEPPENIEHEESGMTHHAKQGEIVDVRPFDDDLKEHRTHTLFKTEHLEAIRLTLPKGKKIPAHHAPGPIVVQCLEGAVSFTALGGTTLLGAGQLLHLNARESHAVEALEDSSLLLTIAFDTEQTGRRG